ncbi:MAG: SCP-2 sterol transfer family protein [Lachnospiraceae bacterium]|nr:SCP-2 sterol transfer family protein [Lachnospiraceae bacterium]
MKINIYYGGRGIMGDPTQTVLKRFQDVLDELNVKVERYNLYEERRSITSLPNTLYDADGVILASTVEWYGIGGYMYEFLDACWLYGNKEKIAKIYMCPIVMSTTYGERDGKVTLQSAWDMLGGIPLDGLSGYVEDGVAFELNMDYMAVIEKKAENFYRIISQKRVVLPASSQAVKQMVTSMDPMNLTPQETEQLSKYVSDENYVQTQKEDIKELSSRFKTLMQNNAASEEDMIIAAFKKHFRPVRDYRATFKFMIKKMSAPLSLEIDGEKMRIEYRDNPSPQILCKISQEKMNDIISGRRSFQHSFMYGDMQIKGDFTMYRMLDQIFPFTEHE